MFKKPTLLNAPNLRNFVPFTLLACLLFSGNISSLAANTINKSEEEKTLNENILEINEKSEVKKLKYQSNIRDIGSKLNVSQEFVGGRKGVEDQISTVKKLNTLEYLAVYENSVDLSASINIKQKKAMIKISQIIGKYVMANFGKDYSVYNLSELQQNQLEKFVTNNDKILKLNKIATDKDSKNIDGITAEAAWWESCEYETNFPDWVSYSYKNYSGRKADWVGRLANSDGERSGNDPCDFSFYINGYRANTVDGWSIATECAVKWSNGVSARRYGYSNQKMIIGWGRLTACGVFTPNTSMLRDQIQFYN